MPVVGTPVAVSPAAGQSTCSTQAATSPAVATVYGCEVNGRRRAVEATQGLPKTINWTCLDASGRPVNLESCGAFDGSDGSSVTLKCQESVLLPGGSDRVIECEGVVSDAAAGAVSFPLTADQLRQPGVYLAEVTVSNEDGDPVFGNQFYLVVNRSLRVGTPPAGAPPSVAEIRLHLRDSDPVESQLLETVQFDAAEIAMAIEQPVLYWNESLPPIDQNHTTSTFPHRFHWLEGVAARLYIMAAHWYRRNHLPHEAGGVAVDDLGKADDYEKVGQQKWAEYKDWVLRQKVSINCNAAIQWSTGGYGPWGW